MNTLDTLENKTILLNQQYKEEVNQLITALKAELDEVGKRENINAYAFSISKLEAYQQIKKQPKMIRRALIFELIQLFEAIERGKNIVERDFNIYKGIIKELSADATVIPAKDQLFFFDEREVHGRVKQSFKYHFDDEEIELITKHFQYTTSQWETQFDTIITQLQQDADRLHKELRRDYYSLNVTKFDNYVDVEQLTAIHKQAFVLGLLHKLQGNRSSENTGRKYVKIYEALIDLLLKSKLDYTPQEIRQLFTEFKRTSDDNIQIFSYWPISYAAQQIEKSVKADGMNDELKSFLQEFLKWPQMNDSKYGYGADLSKVKLKLEKILFAADNGENAVPPYTLPEDRLSEVVNPQIAAIKGDERNAWYELFHLFIKATSGKPAAKYLKATNAIIKKIGAKKYKQVVSEWLLMVSALKDIEEVHEETYNGHVHTWTTRSFLHEKNLIFLKGLIWSLTNFHDTNTLNVVAKLAESAFQKMPGVGPRAAGVGNACIYMLGSSRGLEGISHLSRLKLRIRQNNTKKLIQKYIDETSAKLGVSPEEIEELSIPESLKAS